jgi:hypothetical protein
VSGPTYQRNASSSDSSLTNRGHARPSSARPTMERTRDRGQFLRRGRRFQAARSRRIPVMEGLGDRRVPAALMHDVALVTASTADSRGMSVDNNIEEILMQTKNVKIIG